MGPGCSTFTSWLAEQTRLLLLPVQSVGPWKKKMVAGSRRMGQSHLLAGPDILLPALVLKSKEGSALGFVPGLGWYTHTQYEAVQVKFQA